MVKKNQISFFHGLSKQVKMMKIKKREFHLINIINYSYKKMSLLYSKTTFTLNFYFNSSFVVRVTVLVWPPGQISHLCVY